jgi:hypothetical protein
MPEAKAAQPTEKISYSVKKLQVMAVTNSNITRVIHYRP